MAAPLCILAADGHTEYCSLASCIPDHQRSPAPPVTTKQAGLLPCLGSPVTVAILAQGTSWAVAVTQVFFENGRRQFVILHH
jgi:hypothetical protein